ncbi:hypothetical protein EVAR_95889_1 [Eumeta japonica]|uniref:Uncharacterized protein n=1 Tax=Eumeta variegata TaxID=151549 RepID=A0A4C2AE77_EUMVA|nr:hypothetical protein EVAR_95889_1 [Eumeta japonica]
MGGVVIEREGMRERERGERERIGIESETETEIKNGAKGNKSGLQSQSRIKEIDESGQDQNREQDSDRDLDFVVTGKRACEPSKYSWSPMPMDTHNSVGVTSALTALEPGVANLAAAENGRARLVKYHTFTELRREVTAFAVLFRQMSESSSGSFSHFINPLHSPPNILFLLKRSVTRWGLLWDCKCSWKAVIIYSPEGRMLLENAKIQENLKTLRSTNRDIDIVRVSVCCSLSKGITTVLSPDWKVQDLGKAVKHGNGPSRTMNYTLTEYMNEMTASFVHSVRFPVAHSHVHHPTPSINLPPPSLPDYPSKIFKSNARSLECTGGSVGMSLAAVIM